MASSARKLDLIDVAPFTPADALSMMSLSLTNSGQQNGMMQDALAELHAKDLSYSAFAWHRGVALACEHDDSGRL